MLGGHPGPGSKHNRHPEERAEGARLEGWPQAPNLLPPFETVARQGARPPQGDVFACCAVKKLFVSKT